MSYLDGFNVFACWVRFCKSLCCTIAIHFDIQRIWTIFTACFFGIWFAILLMAKVYIRANSIPFLLFSLELLCVTCYLKSNFLIPFLIEYYIFFFLLLESSMLLPFLLRCTLTSFLLNLGLITAIYTNTTFLGADPKASPF